MIEQDIPVSSSRSLSITNVLQTYLLILATWVTWFIAIFGIGLIAGSPFRFNARFRDKVDAAPWLGLALLLLLVSAANLAVPLGGSAGSTVATLFIVLGWITTVTFLVRNCGRIVNGIRGIFTWRHLPNLVFVALIVCALFLLVRFATAEPMDGDTGLYRMGAINYASEYGTVPGLANIQSRYGFNSSLWSLSALLGNGLWAGEGYRLVIGLLVTVLLTATAIRVAWPRRCGPRPSDWYFVIGTSFTLAIILTDTGRWVPSPGQDISVLVLSIASTGLLLDFVQRPIRWSSGVISVVCAVAAGSLRPLGWVLAGTTLTIVIALAWIHARRSPDRRNELVLMTGISVTYFAVMLAVMLARDALLSGWLLYPLSILPLNVSWLATDPTTVAQWVTSYGRAPGVEKDVVLASNDWFGPWLTTFVHSREVYLCGLMAIGLILPLLWSQGRGAWRRTLCRLGWAWPPTLMALGVWFTSAPDVRFGWAALLGVVAVPLALLLAYRAFPAQLVKSLGLMILIVMAFTNLLNGRLAPRGEPTAPQVATWGMLHVELQLSPPRDVVTVNSQLPDGTPITHPTQNGECWDVFPMCLAPNEGGGTYRLGPDISDGFTKHDPR